MKTIVFYTVSLIGLLFLLPITVPVHASLMVKKHLFVQVTGDSRVKDINRGSSFTEKLKKELEFTGIIKSGSHIKVLIRDKRNKESHNIFEKGDKIRGMVIKDIGRNYVVLENKNTNVRLNLFGSNKKRPVPLKNEAVNVINNAGNALVTGKKRVSSLMSANSDKKLGVKLIKKGKSSVNSGSSKVKNSAGTISGTPFSDKKTMNTFLEMIKKSQQQQKANPQLHNKFMELLKKAKQ